jgi:hypothetical protein
VPLIKQSVDCLSIRSKSNIDGRTDRGSDGPERGDRDRLDVTRFHLRHKRARGPGKPANILLSESSAYSDCPEAPAEPEIDAASLPRINYLPLTIDR